MFIKIIIFILLYFIQNILAYKLIRRIDKRERKKLDLKEEQHVKFMLENTNDN